MNKHSRTRNFVSVIAAGLILGTTVVQAPPAEFDLIEEGEFGVTGDDVDDFNDLVPGLNAKSRLVTGALNEYAADYDEEQVKTEAKRLWGLALDDLGASDDSRAVIAHLLSQ